MSSEETEEAPGIPGAVIGRTVMDVLEYREAVKAILRERIDSMRESSRLEELKGAANDAKIQAYGWATGFLIPAMIDDIMALPTGSDIVYVDEDTILVDGVEYPLTEPADPNRLTPEFVGEPNEKFLIDSVADTVTPLDNPNVPGVFATPPSIPDFDFESDEDEELENIGIEELKPLIKEAVQPNAPRRGRPPKAK